MQKPTINEISEAMNRLGFNVDSQLSPAYGQEMFLGVKPKKGITLTEYIEAGRQLFAFDVGRQWIFGDLVRYGERLGIAEQIAPSVGVSINTQLNQASVSESYPLIASPALQNTGELSRIMDNIANGVYFVENAHFGQLRTPLLKWSHHQVLQSLGNGLTDYRAEMLIQAIRENWSISDLTVVRNSLIEGLQIYGNKSAQKLADRKKVFGVTKVKRTSFIVNLELPRAQMLEQFNSLLDELQAIPSKPREVEIIGRYVYDLTPPPDENENLDDEIEDSNDVTDE